MRRWMGLLIASAAVLPWHAGPASAQGSAAKQAMIERSIAAYSGSCSCPYSTARNGSRCGKRSAYSRAGGASPLCFEHDIPDGASTGFVAAEPTYVAPARTYVPPAHTTPVEVPPPPPPSETARPTLRTLVAVDVGWTLRGADGTRVAWVARRDADEILEVRVGDDVEGMGAVLLIGRDALGWGVRTEGGIIRP